MNENKAAFTNFDFLFVKIQFICLSIKASTSNYKVPTNLHPTFSGILANFEYGVWQVMRAFVAT